MAANSKANVRILIILSGAGIFSLYPLLFHSAGKVKTVLEIGIASNSHNIETPIKITLTLLWFCAFIPGLAYSVKT